MSIYVKLSDFSAQSNVSKDIFTKSDLQAYIDKFEVIILQDLLGAELYEAFKTDFAILGTAPTDPKFIEIWNEFSKDNNCGIVRSLGIKKMLASFINFEYVRDQPSKNNIAGNMSNIQANSEAPSPINTNLITNYNDGVSDFNAIQWLICDNPNSYDWSTYNGHYKEFLGIV